MATIQFAMMFFGALVTSIAFVIVGRSNAGDKGWAAFTGLMWLVVAIYRYCAKP